jgi:hypothetical protein
MLRQLARERIFAPTSFLWYHLNQGIEWRWQFLGFESKEGRLVQAWFDGLHEDVKDEIRDLVVTYLSKLTNKLWRRPEFDLLDGAGGISEIRPKEVSVEKDGEIETETYRIYGFFPKDRRHTYVFLHGTRKGMKNDGPGKRIARDRLRQLEQGKATVHEFSF